LQAGVRGQRDAVDAEVGGRGHHQAVEDDGWVDGNLDQGERELQGGGGLIALAHEDQQISAGEGEGRRLVIVAACLLIDQSAEGVDQAPIAVVRGIAGAVEVIAFACLGVEAGDGDAVGRCNHDTGRRVGHDHRR